MATPWDDFPAVGQAPAAPAYPGVIPGRPRVAAPPTGMQLEDQAMEQRRLELAEQAAARAETAAVRAEETSSRIGVSDSEAIRRKIAAFGKLYESAREFDDAYSGLGSGIESTIQGVTGFTGTPGQRDWWSRFKSADNLVRNELFGASLSGGEKSAYGETTVSQNMAPSEVRANVERRVEEAAEELRRYVASLKAGGYNSEQIDALLGEYKPLVENGVQFADRTTGAGGGEEWTAEKSLAHWGEAVFDQSGNPLGPEGGMAYDANGAELGIMGRVTDDSPNAVPTEAERIANDPRFVEPDAAVIARQGFTMGLSDEAAGIGGAISNALMLRDPVKGYRVWNDVEDAQLARARKNLGGFGTAIEVGSGFGGVGAGGALTRLTTRQALGQGARIGALGGYGYGEGLEGSVINAAGGAVLGGALGGGAQAIGNRLVGPALRSAEQRAALVDRAVVLDDAGRAEGVTVNRAMVDPATANRVTGVDATLSGGPRIQREMRDIEGQIEGRVSDLGRGGNAMDNIATGDRVRGAGERFIERSGKIAKRKYDRAERLAGDARVTPVESLRRVDEMITSLSETGATNNAEIAFLQGIKTDLSQDLSVGALRRMRTKLRKQISRGELTFGEDEARVLAIMDGAADDIRTGLAAQGKDEAARAFDTADTAYRARMEYITGTVQRLLGKRGANPSAEQIAAKFHSMSRTDARGLRRFYATLEPEEAADVSATFAEQIGQNNKGEFSVAHFLSQTTPDKMSDEALRTVFGPEGAQSVRNLRLLGREVNRVTSAMNSRTSKSGVATTYRDWMINALLGATAGGGGALAGGSTSAVAGAAAAVGANAARNAISARLLMSPNLTKWLRQAPRTTDPAAIDRHFARLGSIARAEPALAGDIETLRNAIMQAANDNSAVAVSAAEEPDS